MGTTPFTTVRRVFNNMRRSINQSVAVATCGIACHPPPVLLQTLPLFALGDTMSHHAAAAEADWYTSNNQESSMIRLKARIDRHKRTEVN